MNPDEINQLITVIRGTAEIYGRTMSPIAASILIEDLKTLQFYQIEKALARCRKELRFFPTISDILQRIEDGRPTADEAWAMIPRNEEVSIIWNDEICEAWGIVKSSMQESEYSARQAFIEKYRAIVFENRSKGIVPKWWPSFGTDRAGRESAIQEAVQKNRLTSSQAIIMFPEYTQNEKKQLSNQSLKDLIETTFKDMPK